MIMPRIFALAAIALASAPAPAAPPTCRISAYLDDPDVAGTNVRAAPSASARVVARLPHQRIVDGTDIAPEVEIVEFSNGWARISRAVFADYGDGERPLFKGDGWVSGKLLAATLNSASLREAPNTQARETAHLQGADWGPDSVAVQSIDDCIGEFALITGKLPSGRIVSGWTDRTCSLQVTTCP